MEKKREFYSAEQCVHLLVDSFCIAARYYQTDLRAGSVVYGASARRSYCVPKVYVAALQINVESLLCMSGKMITLCAERIRRAAGHDEYVSVIVVLIMDEAINPT